jgi:hypothetical protein
MAFMEDVDGLFHNPQIVSPTALTMVDGTHGVVMEIVGFQLIIRFCSIA